MVKALRDIHKYKKGQLSILGEEKWLQYLTTAGKQQVNMERINSLEELENNVVLNYVERTLELLNELEIPLFYKQTIEEVLKWSEVAKGGTVEQRQEWFSRDFNLFVHNLGSASIFFQQQRPNYYLSRERLKLVKTLIETHGLIGQFIRGEVPFIQNRPLVSLIGRNIGMEQLRDILYCLNYCIIGGVSLELWSEVKEDIENYIDKILNADFSIDDNHLTRFEKLRKSSIKKGENFKEEWSKNENKYPDILKSIIDFYENKSFWYVEAALHDFSFEEFLKVLTIIYYCSSNKNNVYHISFEPLMKNIYYNYKGKKKINLYKKRIIEKYLKNITIEDIVSGNFEENPHLKHSVYHEEMITDTLFFNFTFSEPAEKLIDFCEVAETNETLYKQAIVMLFDLFELRRDKFDRFHNEEEYLENMNSGAENKNIILDYIKGDTVLDVGPGGGIIMDMIEDRFPDKKVIGVDLSSNVVEELKKKKNIEKRNWNIKQGDALNLQRDFTKGSIQNIIFCSVLHELFSYVETEGSKFNYKTLELALKSAYEILPQGGRIIIRDGIMTKQKDDKRIIQFSSNEGLCFLRKYVKDFKGRHIDYEMISNKEVLMKVNDCMEFLYTYTWGDESYTHEVQEQFGYFTPSEYENFIKKTLGEEVKIITLQSFLQEGYSEHLSSKLKLLDENRNEVSLPDSTCFIVIEK